MPRSSRVIGSQLKTSNRRLRSSGRTATRPPTNNQAEARPQTCAASTDDSLARTILSQHLGKSDDPRGHEQGNRSPPGSPSMPSRPGELPVESDSVRSADYDPEQIDSQGSEEGDFWPIVGIVKERRRNKKLSYLVRWASDPQTGQEFPLQWVCWTPAQAPDKHGANTKYRFLPKVLRKQLLKSGNLRRHRLRIKKHGRERPRLPTRAPLERP